MVYVAFSEAVIEGIWYKVDGCSLLMIAIVSGFLLAIVILFNIYTARYFGFSKANEITILFCSSKKSLVNRVPMANILFPCSFSWYYFATSDDFSSNSINGMCAISATLCAMLKQSLI
ncbi:hypothetical protein ARSQ2_00723 [Arsenophonus endosymbiont of Bemisia tabaci Q2]|nr:hypothetical protein ARSQ2_00723 [Arsenophonus endosymbiont of Bemisia tabaci Q2]